MYCQSFYNLSPLNCFWSILPDTFVKQIRNIISLTFYYTIIKYTSHVDFVEFLNQHLPACLRSSSPISPMKKHDPMTQMDSGKSLFNQWYSVIKLTCADRSFTFEGGILLIIFESNQFLRILSVRAFYLYLWLLTKGVLIFMNNVGKTKEKRWTGGTFSRFMKGIPFSAQLY